MTKESPTVYVLQAIATTKRRKTYSDMGEYESLEEVKEAMKEESREWRERRNCMPLIWIAPQVGNEN